MKWCSGFCGRLLPLEAFHRSSNPGGGPQAECKACHRIKARESYLRKARHSKRGRAFLASEAARKLRAYHARRAA